MRFLSNACRLLPQTLHTSWCQLEFHLRERGGYTLRRKKAGKAKIDAYYIHGQFVAEAGARCSCLAGERILYASRMVPRHMGRSERSGLANIDGTSLTRIRGWKTAKI